MNAIQFLKQQHEEAKAAFGKVLQASPDQRGALWDELKPELEAHEQLEDACLYEPLSREAGPKDAKLTAWRQQHQGEVTKVESLIKSLEGLLAEDARWLNKVQEIHAGLLSHIREEENNIFPSVVTVWDDSRLRQAGMEMEKMKARKARKAA